MEKTCTLLVYFDKGTPALANEIKEQLEGHDTELKVDAMKKAVMLLLNGETLPTLFITIVRYVLPSEDHTIQKLLLLYLEIIEKTDSKGKILPEMILICQNLRNNLQHPNEYIRGVTLRFLSRLNEAELIEPLIPSILSNLEHRHAFVRRNAILAMTAIYKLPQGENLLCDAPEMIEKTLNMEQDLSARRNAFLMLYTCSQDRAVSLHKLVRYAGANYYVEGSPVSSHSSQSSYPRQKHGYYSPNQTSPSRLGPQCSQSLQQQLRHQPGHHPHPHSQQISPEQTPLHPHHGGRRHLPGEVSTSVPPGTLPFQQRQQNYQLQQQQQYHQQQYRSPQPSPDLQLAGPGRGNPNGEAGNSLHGGLLPSPQRDNRLAYFGVNHNTLAGNAITSRMQGGQPEQEGNALSAAGFAIAAGMGHPLHQVQYQQYNGGEQQWPGPGGILPQNFFVNDLFNNMGRRSGPHLIGVRPPTAPARR